MLDIGSSAQSLENLRFPEPPSRRGGDTPLSDQLAKADNFWESFDRYGKRWQAISALVRDELREGLGEAASPNLSLSQFFARLSVGEQGRGLLSEVVPLLADVHDEVFRSLRFGFKRSSRDPNYRPLSGVRDFPELVAQLGTVTQSGFLYWFSGRLRSDSLEYKREVQERIEERVQPDRLKMLTYNVAGLPRMIGGKMPRRYHEIGLHLNASDFDVVAIQEMFSRDTAALIESCGFPFMARSENMHGVFGGNGLLTLSRYPILSTEVFEFERKRSVERSVRKGALCSRVQLGEQQIDVINVHGASTTLFNREPHIQEVRDENYRELARFLERIKTPGVPQFVLGDLNVAADSEEYKPLAERFGTDLYRACHDSTEIEVADEEDAQEIYSGYTFDPERNELAKRAREHPARLDYHFLDEELQDHVAVRSTRAFVDERFRGRPLSDHWGVSTEIFTLPEK